MSSNLGSENQGKVLGIDVDGSVIPTTASGIIIDDEFSTESTNPLQNKVIAEEFDNYVRTIRKSTNLFDKNLVMDHKIINYPPIDGTNYCNLPTYANGIISGYVPLEEGKTYTIYTGENANTNIGCLCFVHKEDDTHYVRVFGCNCTDPSSAYGGGANFWPIPEGKVEITYDSINKSNTFTVLENSGITHFIFYIRKKGSSSNYWGAHTDLTEVDFDNIYQIRLNEGTEILPFEPYGDIEDIKYQTADTLLASNLTTTFNSQLDTLQTTLENEIDSVAGNPKLTLTLTNGGNSWEIVSNINDQTGNSHSIKTTGECQANRTNHVFEFGSIYVDNVSFKGCSDDITPMNGSSPNRWSGTYIGANHGQSNGYTLTFAEPHGKDNSDIGSIWQLGTKQYTIYEVPSTTTVRIVNTLSTPATTGGTLTHVSGATHTEDMVYTSAAMDQMYRAVNKFEIHIYDENWKEIPHDANGVFKSNKFRFVQSYQILNPDKAVEHLQQLKADGQDVTRDNLHDDEVKPFVRQNFCYEFSEGNACTLYQSSDFLDTFQGFHGFVQSGTVNGTPSSSSPEEVYVAGCFDNTPFDIVGTESSISFSRGNWTVANKPPYRYYQYKKNDKSKGFMQGFYTKIGLGRPEIRNTMIPADSGAVGFIYKTGKMYPYAYSGQTFQAGDHVEGIAFYTPFCMDTTDNCYAAVYNYVYDDIILAIDYQEAADVLFKLKQECVGKQIEILDKTDTCVMDRTMASSELLPITFTGKGYIVLRFYDDNDLTKDFVEINQGIENAGKVLQVNASGMVTPVTVSLTTDDAFSTESINPVENRVVTNAINTIDDALFTERASTNLFERSMMIDHKLVNFSQGSSSKSYLATYANSILSGFVPVEEGKTYTVYTGSGSHVGALCFVDSNYVGICGCQAADPSRAYGQGSGSTSQWTGIDGKVTCTYDSTNRSNTFTVLEGSNIAYVIFYIRKKGGGGSDNYWGAHDDLSVITEEDYPIRVNEGTEILPYEPGGIIHSTAFIEKETNVTISDSTATTVADLVTDFNNLLAALRNRSVLAS